MGAAMQLLKGRYLVFTLQTTFVDLVVLPKLLNLRLTLDRVGSHVEAGLRKVNSIFVGTCNNGKLTFRRQFVRMKLKMMLLWLILTIILLLVSLLAFLRL